MPDIDRVLRIAPGVRIPAAEVRARFSRSSGPGGQNVNRRATKVELTFDLLGSESIPAPLKRRAQRRLANRLDAHGCVHVTSQAARTQAANREAALDRLEDLLRTAVAPPPKTRRPTKPSKAAKERRLAQKKERGRRKRLRKPASPDD